MFAAEVIHNGIHLFVRVPTAPNPLAWEEVEPGQLYRSRQEAWIDLVASAEAVVARAVDRLVRVQATANQQKKETDT